MDIEQAKKRFLKVDKDYHYAVASGQWIIDLDTIACIETNHGKVYKQYGSVSVQGVLGSIINISAYTTGDYAAAAQSLADKITEAWQAYVTERDAVPACAHVWVTSDPDSLRSCIYCGTTEPLKK